MCCRKEKHNYLVVDIFSFPEQFASSSDVCPLCAGHRGYHKERVWNRQSGKRTRDHDQQNADTTPRRAFFNVTSAGVTKRVRDVRNFAPFGNTITACVLLHVIAVAPCRRIAFCNVAKKSLSRRVARCLRVQRYAWCDIAMSRHKGAGHVIMDCGAPSGECFIIRQRVRRDFSISAASSFSSTAAKTSDLVPWTLVLLIEHQRIPGGGL